MWLLGPYLTPGAQGSATVIACFRPMSCLFPRALLKLSIAHGLKCRAQVDLGYVQQLLLVTWRIIWVQNKAHLLLKQCRL